MAAQVHGSLSVLPALFSALSAQWVGNLVSWGSLMNSFCDLAITGFLSNKDLIVR